MTRLTGFNKAYFLLVAAAALAVLLAVVFVTQTAAQEPDDDQPGDSMVIAYDGPTGIRVSGNGAASGVPDIAVISLGVESVEDTAAAARANAAAAMADVMQVLTSSEIAERDIQTRYFNISPRYRSVQVTRCSDESGDPATPEPGKNVSCWDDWEQVLTGYSVTNQVSVTVRNLDNAGTVIDQVAGAAGDLVRVNGISFGIEDSQEVQDAALADAVADMQRKAEMLAELSGVKLGRLAYLSEEAFYAPPQPVYARAAALSADEGIATSISAGELEFTANVQGVYLIAEPEAAEE